MDIFKSYPYFIVQNGEQDRLEVVKRQLAEATARSKDAQNTAEDSEANLRSTSTLLETCKCSATASELYVQATQRLLLSADSCRQAATAALAAHSRFEQVRVEVLCAKSEAQGISKLLEASSAGGTVKNSDGTGPHVLVACFWDFLLDTLRPMIGCYLLGFYSSRYGRILTRYTNQKLHAHTQRLNHLHEILYY